MNPQIGQDEPSDSVRGSPAEDEEELCVGSSKDIEHSPRFALKYNTDFHLLLTRCPQGKCSESSMISQIYLLK